MVKSWGKKFSLEFIYKEADKESFWAGKLCPMRITSITPNWQHNAFIKEPLKQL